MFNINEVKTQNNTPRVNYGHIETGTYAARIVQIIGLGVQERPAYMGEQKPPAPFLRVTFELPFETIERQLEDGKTETQPRWLSKEFVFSGAELSTCAKWLKKLDPSNTLGGDWSKAIGMECQVFVTATQGKKDPTKYYNDVKDVMQVTKGMQVPAIFDESKLMVFSTRHITDKTVDQFNGMPKWLQEKITNAVDFPNSPLEQALNGTPPQPKVEEAVASTTNSDDDDPWG
jgi:hypothetical protein